jgi:hypothetical protein
MKEAGIPPMGVTELAGLAQQEPSGKSYGGLRTLINWIRPVHPLYTPNKPGRKKKNH